MGFFGGDGIETELILVKVGLGVETGFTGEVYGKGGRVDLREVLLI